MAARRRKRAWTAGSYGAARASARKSPMSPTSAGPLLPAERLRALALQGHGGARRERGGQRRADRARDAGEGFDMEDARILRVRTDRGAFRTGVVVNAAGNWADQGGRSREPPLLQPAPAQGRRSRPGCRAGALQRHILAMPSLLQLRSKTKGGGLIGRPKATCSLGHRPRPSVPAGEDYSTSSAEIRAAGAPSQAQQATLPLDGHHLLRRSPAMYPTKYNSSSSAPTMCASRARGGHPVARTGLGPGASGRRGALRGRNSRRDLARGPPLRLPPGTHGSRPDEADGLGGEGGPHRDPPRLWPHRMPLRRGVGGRGARRPAHGRPGRSSTR